MSSSRKEKRSSEVNNSSRGKRVKTNPPLASVPAIRALMADKKNLFDVLPYFDFIKKKFRWDLLDQHDGEQDENTITRADLLQLALSVSPKSFLALITSGKKAEVEKYFKHLLDPKKLLPLNPAEKLNTNEICLIISILKRKRGNLTSMLRDRIEADSNITYIDKFFESIIDLPYVTKAKVKKTSDKLKKQAKENGTDPEDIIVWTASSIVWNILSCGDAKIGKRFLKAKVNKDTPFTVLDKLFDKCSAEVKEELLVSLVTSNSFNNVLRKEAIIKLIEHYPKSKEKYLEILETIDTQSATNYKLIQSIITHFKPEQVASSMRKEVYSDEDFDISFSKDSDDDEDLSLNENVDDISDSSDEEVPPSDEEYSPIMQPTHPQSGIKLRFTNLRLLKMGLK